LVAFTECASYWKEPVQQKLSKQKTKKIDDSSSTLNKATITHNWLKYNMCAAIGLV
jgi:hypothetical protein